ncbi:MULTISPECIES: PopZ family protein [Ochrobactrum]|nr:PopZ family protein [Ochrobactrum chromiisoli]
MAQTSSAAREPSMEEILASIRRIIEDSDVSRHPIVAPPSFSARSEVAKFRKPVSVQETLPEPGILSEETVLRGSIQEPALKEIRAVEAPEADDDEDFVLDAQNDDKRSDVLELAARIDDMPPLETQIANELKVSEPVEERKPQVEVPPADLKPQSAAHILSEGTERKVAAAFQDLNHAVHSEPRRSFDDIAADILRPMLQDWLDKNLPTLVERLVREEIERVVRGER